jgi:hypothetical protein
MSQLVKTKRQANFNKDLKRFGAFKGLVEQKKNLYSIRSCVNWAFFWHSFHSRFKLAHSCQKKPNLHTNSLNKLLFYTRRRITCFVILLFFYHIPYNFTNFTQCWSLGIIYTIYINFRSLLNSKVLVTFHKR